MPKPTPDTRTVLVTGASSGIGQACAQHLDRSGFRVFAGVRRDIDAESLRESASSRLHPVRIDVTDPASIAAAVATVTDGLAGAGLAGLINNAGVALCAPLELSGDAEVRHLLEVNVAGTLSMTRALLPLLRRARGRVLNMGSTSGQLALPCLSAYAASKFALRGASDALRLELQPLGVAVILLEIGNIKTPIWDKGLQALNARIAATAPELMDLYGPLVRCAAGVAARAPRTQPERVARTAARALLTPRPRARYRVGPDAWLIALLAGVPRGLRDRVLLACLPRPGAGGHARF